MALDPQAPQRDRPQRPGTRVGICVSRFHEELTGAMTTSAQRELEACGVAADDVEVVWVPGSFELPIVARRLARRPDIHTVLCFGLVLKGETSHDHWVAHGAVQGLLEVSLELDKPLLLGVLTCDTLEQARDRALPPDAGGSHDKGREVARAAIETLDALDAAEGLREDALTRAVRDARSGAGSPDGASGGIGFGLSAREGNR